MSTNAEKREKLDNLVDAVKYAQELEVCVDQLEDENEELANENKRLKRIVELNNSIEENLKEQIAELEKENAELAADLKNCENVKIEEFMPEFKRTCINELEEMDAERIKEWLVDIVSEVLTGEED